MSEFTPDEINDLIQLLDVATKAGGLQAASKALPLALKLQQMGRSILEPQNESQTANS